ncbi:hypothetical protein [Halorarum halobium]|uniref:hypothetical protein n=1 Tax=Halorarum halobium TaxID=3075121 RepID=UPI0028AEA033|nr:hypothetical protein [Halobaculum sp. XH14]
MPSSDPPWRYGVAVFPLVPLATLTDLVGFRVFLELVAGGSTSEAGMLAAVVAFLVSAVVSIAGGVAALVVLGALLLDARALRRTDAAFAPHPAVAGVVGLVHLLAWLLAPLYVLSVPALAYYTYRRFA